MENEWNLNHVHPFMAVRREQFTALQQKAEHTPWKEMKQDALKQFHELQFNPDDCYVARCTRARVMADTAALVYILEPSLKEQCVQRLLDIISLWQPETVGNLYDEMYKSSGDHWIGAIPPGATFSICLLALDILYNELTEEQRIFCEQTLEVIANNFIENDENHMVAILGVRGLWALYTGQKELLLRSWEEWKEHVMSYITEDGAGVISIDYSIGRFVRGDRVSKIILPIVMDFTGLDKSFYSNPEIIAFAEWALGYTFTPTKNMWVIGDTLLHANVKTPESLHMAYSAAKYSEKAAEYAAWHLKNRPLRGTLLNYLLLEKDFAEPHAPESRIFNSCGAWFYENMDDENSMAGLLWNSVVKEVHSELDLPAWAVGHAHKEINSVSLAAYGTHLYANAGYSGWSSGPDEFTWNYINSSALSANTVLVDYDYKTPYDPTDENDHCKKIGAGITEGFISSKLRYALGNSGGALPNAVHNRGFVMVSGDADAPGYWLLLDRVDAGSKMTVVHRPFSDTYKIEQENTEYTWSIDHAGLTVFLATPPSETEIIDGIVADRVTVMNKNFTETRCGRKIKSLLASYSAKSSAATLLFPFDDEHRKPSLQRTDCGMKIVYPHCEDLILTKNTCGGETAFCGAAVIIRCTENGCSWFFVQAATSLVCKGTEFHSEQPISMFFDGVSGVYTAHNNVPFTLSANMGEALQIDDAAAHCEQDGSISCVLPAGTHSIKLIK